MLNRVTVSDKAQRPLLQNKRRYLHKLAAACAAAWREAPCQPEMRGGTRVETKNTVYRFRDGICISVTRQDGAWRSDPTALIGMKLVGWLARTPNAELANEWEPGAYAVLWRPREGADVPSSIGLTSAAHLFRLVDVPELSELPDVVIPPPPESRARPRSRRPELPALSRPATQSAGGGEGPVPGGDEPMARSGAGRR